MRKVRITTSKGQSHMTETIAILFIFFVLVFFGILFYYKYSQVSLKQEKEELLGKRAIETTLKALFLPELICSNGEAEPEDNCVDMLKVRHANVTFRLHNQTYRFHFVSSSNFHTQVTNQALLLLKP